MDLAVGAAVASALAAVGALAYSVRVSRNNVREERRERLATALPILRRLATQSAMVAAYPEEFTRLLSDRDIEILSVLEFDSDSEVRRLSLELAWKSSTLARTASTWQMTHSPQGRDTQEAMAFRMEDLGPKSDEIILLVAETETAMRKSLKLPEPKPWPSVRLYP